MDQNKNDIDQIFEETEPIEKVIKAKPRGVGRPAKKKTRGIVA